MFRRSGSSQPSQPSLKAVQSAENFARSSDFSLALQALSIPLAFWFKPICVLVAVSWLIYRTYQVLNKPLDDLASVLGLDIPPVPTVDLAAIRSDGAIIRWTVGERQKQKGTLRYDIHLNGVAIDNVPSHESAVTITGLSPDSHYIVRVALVNNLDFSARSAPVRFRTKPATSNDSFSTLVETRDADGDVTLGIAPRVHHYDGLKDVEPITVDSRTSARDLNSNIFTKQTSVSRRGSEIGLESRLDNACCNEDGHGGRDSMTKLTERLDMLRRETDELERMAKEEEDEESRLKEELTKERDVLKAEVAEKEKTSRNLKREVNVLERQNTAAQNERTKHERLFQQKQDEREKLKSDVLRWQSETEEMRLEIENIRLKKIKYLNIAEEEKRRLQAKQEEELVIIRGLDDEIRDKTTEMKKIEHLMKATLPNVSEAELGATTQDVHEAEEDRKWASHRLQLQQQYAMAVQKLEAAKNFHTEQARYLESLRADRRRQEEFAQYASPPSTQERPSYIDEQSRRRRAPSGHSSDSPRLTTFPLMAGSSFANNMNSIAPFGPPTFLNIHNGMTIAGPSSVIVLSDEEKERLTGGAPMSPNAAAELLPADLFSGDDDRKRSAEHIMPLPGLGTLPGHMGGLTGSLQANAGDFHGPASPASASSRSPSIFASPRGSSHNLHLHSPEAGAVDSDRRSIRSTRSNRAISGANAQGALVGSRFSSMFGIKQRQKPSSADEGLAFGQAQSHSLPKQDPALNAIYSLHRKRNSSLSGPSNETTSMIDGHSPESQPATRRSGFGALFGRERGDGWPSNFTAFGRRPVSPRPVSTHSTELPRPSVDSSRWGVDGWPTESATGGARNSPLSFGPGFNISSSSRLFGSRLPSRRPSAQLGSSGPPEDILEDEDYEIGRHVQPLAPIGTRPRDQQGMDLSGDENARLNPAAKDFKSLFANMRGKDKSKTLSSERHSGHILSNTISRDFEFEDSPPNSRKSRDTRDTRSVTGTESSIAESGRNSNELIRTPSYSNSDAPIPSPLVGSVSSIGKESFMQKITRKSSSGKFSLPTFKREKNRLDPSSALTSPAVPTSTAEDDEDPLSASFNSLTQRENRENARQGGRAWSTVLKIGKKKGTETPSLRSLASVDDDEGDEEVTTPSLTGK